jgi:hypothetical protein
MPHIEPEDRFDEYPDSNIEWCADNQEAIDWLRYNHVAIRQVLRQAKE